ncbi:MAG: hypothetical protein H6974_14150 [Gammaproteobacteria bacterium]|nr:hypothetical protein [Gammaproteobacteria bacterium]
MADAKNDLLKRYAARYIWWKTPEEALRYPTRIIAQVMNIGTFDDTTELTQQFGEETLKQVLAQAEIGQFNGRSWAYWHYRLGITRPDQEVPPLPQQRFL